MEEAKVSGDAIVLCFDNGRRRIGSEVRYIIAEEHSEAAGGKGRVTSDVPFGCRLLVDGL